MKQELSSLDIKFILDELQDLVDGKIQKVYVDDRELYLTIFLSGKGTKRFVAGKGKIFLTNYKVPHMGVPTHFCMYLRKRLTNQRITEIKQHDFERIVIIHTENYKLIIELFGKGNIILTDKKNVIDNALEFQKWKDRTLKKGDLYQLPPARLNILKITKKEFVDVFTSSDKQIVAFLATKAGLGGKYAEEVCLNLEIDKTKTCNSFDRIDLIDVLIHIKDLAIRKSKPRIVYDENQNMKDVAPFSLGIHSDSRKRHFESFNEAVDEFFMRTKSQALEEKQKAVYKQAEDSMSWRLNQQNQAIETLKTTEKESVDKAELVYTNYSLLNEIIKKINEVVEQEGWDALKEKSIDKVKEINLADKTMIVDLGVNVKIDLNKSLEENASYYYEKSKRARQKREGVVKAIGKTEENLKYISLKEKPIETSIEKRDVKEKKWYENFRWFVSSSEFLCVGGKDATTNEILIKKHMENKDVVFHTEMPGSPFVLIKTEGREVDERALEEATQFTACYSRAWAANLSITDVYWVNPDQVSKTPPSGEYIAKGAFMIYGKRNWYKPELKIAFAFYNGEIISGPVGAIESKTQKVVIIQPGDVKSKELAEMIKRKLYEVCNQEEREILKKINIEEIQRFVPAGKGSLV